MEPNKAVVIRAVAPWLSVDAAGVGADLPRTEQGRIDYCLSCPHAECLCDLCDGCGNLRTVAKRGRKRAEYDVSLLRELLRLRVCDRLIAERLGVSRRTVVTIKRRLREEAQATV